VLGWPGETVTIAAGVAEPFLAEQRELLHGHLLEHNGTGMLRNLRDVRRGAGGGRTW
jgi:hypothetical protein